MQFQPTQQPTQATPITRQHYLIQIKSKWTDDWETINYLEALSAIDCAAPGMPKATFRYLAGYIKREDKTSFFDGAPPDLTDNCFVMIQIIAGQGQGGDPYTLWVGRFGEVSTEFFGVENSANYQDQTITAYGLQHDLDRASVRGSFITNDASTNQQITIDLIFNERYVRGFREIGNRSAAMQTVNGKQTYVFANAVDGNGASYPWSVLDILNYLIACHTPASIPFTIGGQTDALATLIFPHVTVGRQSLLQLIDELVDRRRGLGWSLRTTGAGNVEIHIFTVFKTAVTVGGTSVPGNQQQITIDVSQQPALVRELKTESFSVNDYGTIIVYGEPVVSCFTVSFQDGTLREGWTPAKQNLYNLGVPAGLLPTPGFIVKICDEARASPALSYVYTTFKIPASWKWQSGDGEGGVGLQPANSAVDDNGHTTGKAGLSRTWGQTLLRSLPILKDQANLADPDGLQPEYLEPMGFVKDPITKRYVHAHDPGGPPGSPSAHLRMLDHDFGLEVKFSPPHVLGLTHFTAATQGGDANPSSHLPKYDYKTLIATVAARTDIRLQVVTTIPGGDPDRVLQIHIEDAEMWIVMPNTITGIKPGGKFLRPYSVPKILRDDSPRLREIAALARAWYSEEHYALTLTVTNLRYDPVGSLVTKVVDGAPDRAIPHDVGTCLTEMHWDLETMTTTVRTHFAELDFHDAGGRASSPTIH